MNNSITLDTKIQSDASQISSDYADLLSLTLRQVMSAIEITILRDKSGNWNQSDVKVFMKNMDSTSHGYVKPI